MMPNEVFLKHRVQYGLFCFALGLFRVLPLDWSVGLCGLVWRIIGPRSRRGKPAGVYRQLENPYVDRTLRKHREQLYTGGLFTKGNVHDKGPGGQRTARLMTDFVRQGGNLAFVLDQVDRRGIAIPFFGGEAKFTPVPAMIARHVGARIWMARSLRIGKRSRFLIELKELEIKRTGDRREDIRAATAAIFRQFESWIRDAPEQWLWFNTRFEIADPLEHALASPVAPSAAKTSAPYAKQVAL